MSLKTKLFEERQTKWNKLIKVYYYNSDIITSTVSSLVILYLVYLAPSLLSFT